MKKNIFLTLTGLLIVTFINAQGLRLGVKAGANLQKLMAFRSMTVTNLITKQVGF